MNRINFDKAHHSKKVQCALIGQLSSALLSAEYLKHVLGVERLLIF